MSKLVILTVLSMATTAWGFSGGAPDGACGDMTPQHLVKPQTAPFPYKVSISSDTIKAGEETKITISNGKFKGFLVQVRDGDQPVGSFQLTDDKEAKAINCNKVNGSAATHRTKNVKSEISLLWKAPAKAGKYTVYATVVKDGPTFWVAQPSGTITVV